MIHSVKLGTAGGILWGFCMFICTILAVYTGYASQFLNMMVDIYPGYTISWVGAIVGMMYGFIDGFVGLFLLGWLYNHLPIKE